MPAPSWTSLSLPAGALPAGVDYSRVVLFDGVCTLCDGTVNFLIARDGAARLRFAALQSRAAAPVLAACGLDADPAAALDSILFVERARGGGGGYTVFRRSTAVLRIASELPAPWAPLAAAALCVPAALRDAAYGCVAAYRYRVFGKSEDCLRPTAAIRARFLDADELQAAGRSKVA
jgi:predicted DCC family thiol-disulfide oxidoreductase YuxK